jgi:membrane protein YdbS with pleckstrin-like domain
VSDFKVDETGKTRDGYYTLPKKSMGSMYVRSIILLAVLAIVAVASDYFLVSEEITGFPVTALMSVYVLMTIYLLIWPAVYYARYRYRINEDRIDIRRGVFVIKHTVVPTERVHQLEVARGPINNLFGLADVTITTAGGIAAIQYLDRETAAEIADSLNEYITDIIRSRE